METNTTQQSSLAERMKTATITDTTRSYLIVLAQLFDFETECYRILERDYGIDTVDNMMKKTNELLFDVRIEVEKMVVSSINNNIYDNEFTGI